MTNPLIAKYEELYGKKEEPKPEPKKEYLGLSQEQMDIVSKYLTDPKNYSTTSVTPTTINPNSVNAITAANLPPPLPTFKTLTSYDTHSVEDSFLQIAEKVKNKEARVASMSMNMEHYRRSVTFEVLLDT